MKNIERQTHWYGVKIYKDGKFIGSHNGIRMTKRMQWFVKDVIDMFIDELNEKAAINPSLKIVVATKECKPKIL